MRHIISILVENEPGALSRVVDLFAARAYNIETLTVAPTEDPSLSRMTIVSKVGKEREEMKRMADIFRGRIIDVTEKTYTIELTGDSHKCDAFIEALDSESILETVRTGSSGISRGDRILKV